MSEGRTSGRVWRALNPSALQTWCCFKSLGEMSLAPMTREHGSPFWDWNAGSCSSVHFFFFLSFLLTCHLSEHLNFVQYHCLVKCESWWVIWYKLLRCIVHCQEHLADGRDKMHINCNEEIQWGRVQKHQYSFIC